MISENARRDMALVGGAILSIAATFLLMPFVVGMLYLSFQGLTRYHKRDALAFYQKEVRRYIQLPPAVRLIYVSEKKDMYGSSFYTLRFTLPDTAPPSTWVKQICKENGFAPNASDGALRFSANHAPTLSSGPFPPGRPMPSPVHSGRRTVEYLPQLRQYHAVVGND